MVEFLHTGPKPKKANRHILKIQLRKSAITQGNESPTLALKLRTDVIDVEQKGLRGAHMIHFYQQIKKKILEIKT